MSPGDMGQAVALQVNTRGFELSTALEGRSARSRRALPHAGADRSSAALSQPPERAD